MEPYRLCLAHGECSAIALNEDISFATLKVNLNLRAAIGATVIEHVTDWHEYLRRASRHFEGAPRPVWASLGNQSGGADFDCPDSQGDEIGMCKFVCTEFHCVNGYLACIRHADCEAIEVTTEGGSGGLDYDGGGAVAAAAAAAAAYDEGDNSDSSAFAPGFTWVTLKTNVTRRVRDHRDMVVGSGVQRILAGNKSAWHVAFRSMKAAVDAKGQSSSWIETYERLAPLTVAETLLPLNPDTPARPIVLTTSVVTGHDFGCAAGDGVDLEVCTFECLNTFCVEAYWLCLELAECLGVQVTDSQGLRAPHATLKTYLALSENEAASGDGVVRSEADWLERAMPGGKWDRHQMKDGGTLLPPEAE